MAKFELKLPKMGESVAEATVTNWLKEVGDTIELDEPVVEIATDKVDSEVPSEVEGVLVEKLFEADDVVQVGQTLAIIETEGEGDATPEPATSEANEDNTSEEENASEQAAEQMLTEAKETTSTPSISNNGERFYSPLVKSIAQEEGIAQEELDQVEGTGLEGRVTKDDILTYVAKRKDGGAPSKPAAKPTQAVKQETPAVPVSVNGGDEIIEMSRMGKMISKHMIASVQTSAHVQSFIEVDVTNIWNWRNKVKNEFQKREGEKLTFTPIFMEAVAKAIRDFPMINISVDGDKVIKKKDINLGMAAALPDGNLIVPVIKECQNKNLIGITKSVNDLAKRARSGELKPDEIQGGTITMTNGGTFGNLMGTPIINQPQVAIMACGVIKKKPVVLETESGDVIAIRHMMFLSLSYDHRVVDGALGGQFVRKVADYLEKFDINQTI